MHDYLFENQKALDDSHLLQYAEKVDLGISKLKREMTRRVDGPLIERSLKTGIHVVVTGTPEFFVNSKRYEASWDLETFSDFLNNISL